MSTFRIQFDTILSSDSAEGAEIRFDRGANELIIRAWTEKCEIAFLRIGVEEFLRHVGLDKIMDARIKQGVADGLHSRLSVIESDVRSLNLEAARLLCPYSVGDIIEASSPKKGRFRILSIHDRHLSWAVTCAKVDASGAKCDHHLVEFNYTSNLRLLSRPEVRK